MTLDWADFDPGKGAGAGMHFASNIALLLPFKVGDDCRIYLTASDLAGSPKQSMSLEFYIEGYYCSHFYDLVNLLHSGAFTLHFFNVPSSSPNQPAYGRVALRKEAIR